MNMLILSSIYLSTSSADNCVLYPALIVSCCYFHAAAKSSTLVVRPTLLLMEGMTLFFTSWILFAPLFTFLNAHEISFLLFLEVAA